MKLEINCPACANGFVVDATAAAGTQFICPFCSVPVVMPVNASPEPPPPVDTAPQTEPVDDNEVVCPRCQLHFSPVRRVAERPVSCVSCSSRS